MAFFYGLSCWLLSFTFLTAVASSMDPTKDVAECSCGYYDDVTGNWFTESAIVYFNETEELPEDVFYAQQYVNQREKGWNTQFRQGASVSNVQVGSNASDRASTTSLELFVNPSTSDHVVVGGAVRTVRQDIFYGSFRMLLRSPQALGSSLSMVLDWNDTQSLTTNLQSTDDYSNAWVSMLNADEFQSRSLGVNYSILANNTPPWNNDVSPWNYTEFQVDWAPNQVNWTIGGKIFRQLNRTNDKFPQTPVPLVLKHYSVGNWFSMQGPPVNRSVANVGWVRLFFNSSLATDEDRDAFVRRCGVRDACEMADTSLRGSSSYLSAATSKWKQTEPPRDNKEVATIILIICGAVSLFLTCNALLRRTPWEQIRKWQQLFRGKKDDATHTTPYAASVRLVSNPETPVQTPAISRVPSFGGHAVSPVPSVRPQLSRKSSMEPMNNRLSAVYGDEDNKNRKGKSSSRQSWREFMEEFQATALHTSDNNMQSPSGSLYDGETTRVQSMHPIASSSKTNSIAPDKFIRPFSTIAAVLPTPDASVEASHQEKRLGYGEESSFNANAVVNQANVPRKFETREPTQKISPVPVNVPPAKQRVDYLAGLIAFSCLLVTAIHFCLTFVPAAINPGAYAHYSSEIWARKTIDSYFLNLIWIGPFLMTSGKFLVSRYLRHGDLSGVAEKVVGRPFRLLIPILAMAMLEYFLMDSGAISWLEYLPSITWCTWPFTTVPDNFGKFISDFLELAYLIPNAAPQITFNYCTGVLWTIPVQLQGSWVCLLAVIVIREIRRPWKRFGFYTFCILMHWYALSWGTYFYLAIMLTDLDITYKCRRWLYARPFIYVPLFALLASMAFGALSLDMATQWTGVQYAAYEYGIHPDIPTGLPIMWTGAAGYPQYYVPTLHGVIFSFGIQALIELSPVVQKIFSFKLFIWLFPHIYTIYLIHGFIFWSLGSAICIHLAAKGVSYRANLLIVAVSCYAVLFASLPLLTPVVETLGKKVTHNIWHAASETPAPRRPTLYPFPSNFLFVRQSGADEKADGEVVENVVVTARRRSTFKRFMASVAAVSNPRLWFTSSQDQPADAISMGPPSRQASVTTRSITVRNVGWRAGRLSGNVDVLRRNNSTGAASQQGR